MGVFIFKQIVTGIMFSGSELTEKQKETITKIEENDYILGNSVRLITLNPYGEPSIFRDYFIGIIDTEEEGSDRRPGADEDELMEEVELNQESAQKVQQQLEVYKLVIDNKCVKTYRVNYFY